VGDDVGKDAGVGAIGCGDVPNSRILNNFCKSMFLKIFMIL